MSAACDRDRNWRVLAVVSSRRPRSIHIRQWSARAVEDTGAGERRHRSDAIGLILRHYPTDQYPTPFALSILIHAPGGGVDSPSAANNRVGAKG